MLEQAKTLLIDIATTYGLRLVGAIVLLIIGFWVIKRITISAVKLMSKRDIDASLQPFFKSLINIGLKTVLIVTALSIIGIEMTSLIAILGAAGLAIGMALSGTLQNFAGGVVILLFKPFRVGHFIDAKGYTGTVCEIQIFNTVLKTPDNKTVIIPNGELSNSALVNFSTEPKRRVDVTVGIAYGDDTAHAKKVLQRICDADDRIHKDPAVFIEISALADNSVNFALRAWVDAPNYWPVYHRLHDQIYNTFAQEGLNIPFPQMDVHVHKS